MKILVGRPDCIGAMVRALPALAWLRRVRPDWEVHALVAPRIVPLIENDPAVAAIYTWDGSESAGLADRLARERYDAAVVFDYQAEFVQLLKRARIRRRFGALSKTSNWLFLSRDWWRGRSRFRRHECDDNLDLVRRLVGRSAGAAPADLPLVHLSEPQRDIGRCFRRDEAAGAETLAFLHPGGGAATLDFPSIRFAALANDLARRAGWRVFLTGSHADRPAIDAMARHLDRRVEVLAERFPLREFLGVLAAGDLMVASDTGPLHLAAALDLAVVGIYAPAPALNPRRTGPRGRWSQTVQPPLDCPAKRHCLMAGCVVHNCLETIDPMVVSSQAVALTLARSRDLAAFESTT